MYAVRRWSVRHAGGLERLYGLFARALLRLHPLWQRIGYGRLERPVAAGARRVKGLLFDRGMFVHSHGVGTSRGVRIFKPYGADATQLIPENPYRLARDIRGIGFKTADKIARRLGIEPTAMIRARAGISYALAEAMDEGHCGLPRDELMPLAEQLLEIPGETIQAALELEL